MWCCIDATPATMRLMRITGPDYCVSSATPFSSACVPTVAIAIGQSRRPASYVLRKAGTGESWSGGQRTPYI
jgi:hypothetical protein